MENNFEILERVKDDIQIIEINGELDAILFIQNITNYNTPILAL